MSDVITKVVILNKDQYRALERSLPPPVVVGTTTELQAGFALGVQHVLKALREGYVV